MSDFSAVTQLVGFLGNVSDESARRASLVVRKAAFDIQARAKARCPVDTGNLRNSITAVIGRDGLSAQIGPTAHYGAFVEYGTSRMAPQPYLGPATREVESGFIKALGQIGGTP